MEKGQGALEYLLLIGGAVLIAVVVLSFLVGASEEAGQSVQSTKQGFFDKAQQQRDKIFGESTGTSLLFSDDFSDSGFTSTNWSSGAGSWSVSGGELLQTGLSGITRYYTKINATDYSIEVDCKSTSATGELKVLFSDADAGETKRLDLFFYSYNHNTARLTFAGQLPNTSFNFIPNTNYHVKIDVLSSQNKVTTYINGVKAHEVTASFTSDGFVALGTYTNGTAHFDNFSVTEIS